VRLFVAAYPPPAALDHLATRLDSLALGRAAAAGINVRLAARSLWHITLAFIGELDLARVDAARSAVQAATAVTAPLTGLRIAGGGRFGRGRFTVVWAGLATDPALAMLAGTLRRQLGRARVPYARTPLRAHLTLARPGQRLPADQLAADLAALRAYQGPLWSLQKVHLVRSALGPAPVHESIGAYPLTGA
jgi:RNA 2',3'-cyclic 3'-phosphodiesterase